MQVTELTKLLKEWQNGREDRRLSSISLMSDNSGCILNINYHSFFDFNTLEELIKFLKS